MASLVEREARVDDERGKVARVIYNRLAEPMPLQIDATVLFASGLPAQESVSFKDREVNFAVQHLQDPGPAPGADRQPRPQVVGGGRQPAAGNWLYYVLTDPTGGTPSPTTTASSSTR